MKKSGGKRIGAGRPKKYGEATKTFSFACPVSKFSEMNLIIKQKLKDWEVK